MSDRTPKSRAAAVRARRQGLVRRHKTRPNSKSKNSVRKSVHEVPVQMRGGRADLPVDRKKLSKVRRRYDISLGASGGEVKLPAFPIVRIGWRWLSGIMVIGLVALMGMMWNHPYYLVESIEVSGLYRLEAREVQMVLGIQNMPIFTLNPGQLVVNLRQAFPEFSSVDVQVGLPNHVLVSVVERQPILGWENPQGMVLVDATGQSFPARGVVARQGDELDLQGLQLPVIDAKDLFIDPSQGTAGPQLINPYIGRQLLSPQQVAGILQVVDAAPEEAKIVFDPGHGIGWKDPSGWIVYFGIQGNEISAKLQMYDAVVEDLQSQGIRPAFISVEYLHAPYYRMER